MGVRILRGKQTGHLQDKYQLGKVLGKGAFGTVYAAQNLKTGKTYAVKCIEKSKLVTEVGISFCGKHCCSASRA